MMVVGMVGYIETPRGLKSITTVWAQHLSEECKRRFYKNWGASKNKKAFSKYVKKYTEGTGIDKELQKIEKYCTILRVICHTQISKLNFRQKKAHIAEVQVNGGDMAAKVAFAKDLFEKPVSISSVFEQDEMLDTMAITKGHGYEGVVTRWGVTRLPRKTHKGLRKVGCIGSWHPSRVMWTVARAGQRGYHHRTEANKRIYRIGKSAREVNDNATTDNDVTQKNITPMGGFPHYGNVLNDYVMLKGCTIGLRKRTMVLRKAMFSPTLTGENAGINLKFIDTSSKYGHGRFQTVDEKNKFFGARKAK